MEERNEMIKPFTVEVTKEDENKPLTPTEEVTKQAPKPITVIKDGVEMIQPFTTIDTPVKKLYLILRVYNDMDAGEGELEQIKDFEFFTGTSQELYDKLKEEIIDSKDDSVRQKLDIMDSIVMVDSSKITLSVVMSKKKPCSVYKIMRNLKEQGKIVDDTSFDIEDYRYGDEE